MNGEGDRLSGLVVDVFAGVIGVSSSAVWVEAFQSDIEAALVHEFSAEEGVEIIWRRSDGRLQQDGWKGNDSKEEEVGGNLPSSEPVPPPKKAVESLDVAPETRNDDVVLDNDVGRVGVEEKGVEGHDAEGGEDRRPFRDSVAATVVKELGIRYEVRPQFGQKTGDYCTESVTVGTTLRSLIDKD